MDLLINAQLTLPETELQYRTARSSGPGGQHVNKSETQIELMFDVAHSPSLSDVQRDQLLQRLANLIDKEGVLHLTSQSERSQLRNREIVTTRFRQLLAQALRVPKKRRPTKPTAASKERRIQSKKQRGQVKKLRKLTRDE
jgi:ribosome-associated protein